MFSAYKRHEEVILAIIRSNRVSAGWYNDASVLQKSTTLKADVFVCEMGIILLTVDEKLGVTSPTKGFLWGTLDVWSC